MIKILRYKVRRFFNFIEIRTHNLQSKVHCIYHHNKPLQLNARVDLNNLNLILLWIYFWAYQRAWLVFLKIFSGLTSFSVTLFLKLKSVRHTKKDLAFARNRTGDLMNILNFFLCRCNVAWCGGLHSRLWIEDNGFESHQSIIGL